MNPYQINFALRLAAVALIAAVPCAVGVGLLVRLDSADAVRAPLAAARPGPRTATTTMSVDAFGPILDRPLRPAFGDDTGAPTSVPADAPTPDASAKTLRLVGTVGNSIAMVKGPDDTIALVEVGDDVEGADVVAIGEQRIDLKRNGRVIRLEKSPPPSGGDAILIR